MSLLNQLHSPEGSRFPRKRKGRGDATGQGGTAGKGHKGQKARTGGRVRRGFEGGQMPLYRRMPKFGFNNIFRDEFLVVNVGQLESLKGAINPETLRAAGLIKGQGRVKVLATGALSKAITVSAHGFSKKAVEVIQAAGGKAEVIQP